MKIKNTKYFQRTYYVIECELNYCKAQKIFNTNILHTNIFNMKIFQATVMYNIHANSFLCSSYTT